MPTDDAPGKLAALTSMMEFAGGDVRDALKGGSLSSLQAILVDSRYRALSLDDWRTVIAATTDSWKQYKSEVFDCDDFARCQAALVSLHYNVNGCGQVYDTSGQHSYNVILVTDGDSVSTRIVEPQTGRILDKDEVGTGHYAETEGFVVI